MTGYGGTCVLLYYGKFSRTVEFLWISLLAQKLILQMLYHMAGIIGVEWNLVVGEIILPTMVSKS